MNPMINMILVLEKELEMEQQGMRRTRRYIGDARELIDERWYQTDASQIVETRSNSHESGHHGQVNPDRKIEHQSILGRLFHLPRNRHLSACNKC